MPKRKQYRIKWQDSDKKELQRLVRNFNAKVSRIEKKAKAREQEVFEATGERIGVVVPEKQSVKQLMGLIKTRQDLKREMKRLERFTTRGSEEFVSVPNNKLEITSWQRKEMIYMGRKVNKMNQEKVKWFEQLEATSLGQPLGYSVAEGKRQIAMGRADKVQFEEIPTFIPRGENDTDISKRKREINMRFRSFRTKAQSTYYTDQDYRVRENYLKGIKENYNMKDPDVEKIYNAIEEMPIDKFLEIFYKEGDRTTFDFASPKGYKKKAKNQNLELEIQGASQDSYVEALKDIWINR